jgi:hypothetical protein
MASILDNTPMIPACMALALAGWLALQGSIALAQSAPAAQPASERVDHESVGAARGWQTGRRRIHG